MCAKYMKIRQLVGLFMMLLPAFVFAANSPVLLFSDLITGPDVGLGDGKGSGVIVTVWGQNLGSSQGDGTLEFCDSEGVCREGYLYYWKNADGNLPGGPANLFESHAMQEIAFSIPDSAQGTGEIQLTKGNRTSTLPFTVRAGTIYHVKSSGSDSGDGSWDNPWLTVGKATASPMPETLCISTMWIPVAMVKDAISTTTRGSKPTRAIKWRTYLTQTLDPLSPVNKTCFPTIQRVSYSVSTWCTAPPVPTNL